MIESLLNLLAPVKCVYCQVPKTLFCPDHLSSLQPISVGTGDIRGYYAHELDAPLLAALSAFKDRSITALAKVLSEAMGQLVEMDVWVCADLVVIPPSTPKAFRSRGFVPVRLLLGRSKNRLPIVQLGLARRILDQRSLDATARKSNLAGAFRSRPLSGKKVVLFDDVMTTAATLGEMKRAVTEAGGQVTGFCVLARRFPDSDNSQKI